MPLHSRRSLMTGTLTTGTLALVTPLSVFAQAANGRDYTAKTVENANYFTIIARQGLNETAERYEAQVLKCPDPRVARTAKFFRDFAREITQPPPPGAQDDSIPVRIAYDTAVDALRFLQRLAPATEESKAISRNHKGVEFTIASDTDLCPPLTMPGGGTWPQRTCLILGYIKKHSADELEVQIKDMGNIQETAALAVHLLDERPRSDRKMNVGESIVAGVDPAAGIIPGVDKNPHWMPTMPHLPVARVRCSLPKTQAL